MEIIWLGDIGETFKWDSYGGKYHSEQDKGIGYMKQFHHRTNGEKKIIISRKKLKIENISIETEKTHVANRGKEKHTGIEERVAELLVF